MNAPKRRRTGLASLAQAGGTDDFSIVEAIGGVRGVVESMLPGMVFVVVFVITRDVRLTVWIAAVLAVLQVVARLVQRQSVSGALGGLVSVGICLIWAWRSNQARDYFLFGFYTNAVYVIVLTISLLVRVPGLGAVIEFIRSLPTEHFRSWLHAWLDDRELCRAYTTITVLWIVVFLLRLGVQVPLYLTNHVAALGTARLMMGIPFWALAIWVSYLIIATPMHRHAAKRDEDASDDDAESRTLL